MGRFVLGRWATLMLVVVALAAALSASACADESSEAGTALAQERSVEAVRQDDGASAEPLTLALSAPQTCEAERAGEAWGDSPLGWWHPIAEVDVVWTVSGGTEPYTLTIDGEMRDHVGYYVGASGIAWVSCGPETGGAFIVDPTPGWGAPKEQEQAVPHIHTVDPYPGWGSPKERRYWSDPQVDSGLKTIRATVTDGAGATAEASVDVYVILQIEDSGEILESGKTYRVHRFLVTVPEGMTLEIGGFEVNGSESVKLYTLGPRYRTWISIDTFSGEACCRRFRHGYGRVRIDGTLWQTPEEEAAGVEPRRIEVPEEVKRFDALFDELVESINRLPTVDSAD